MDWKTVSIIVGLAIAISSALVTLINKYSSHKRKPICKEDSDAIKNILDDHRLSIKEAQNGVTKNSVSIAVLCEQWDENKRTLTRIENSINSLSDTFNNLVLKGFLSK